MTKSTDNSAQKSEDDIDRIIRNTAFSMEVEGFYISPEQKEDWCRVLVGEIDSQVLMDRYLDKARRCGAGDYDVK